MAQPSVSLFVHISSYCMGRMKKKYLLAIKPNRPAGLGLSVRPEEKAQNSTILHRCLGKDMLYALSSTAANPLATSFQERREPPPCPANKGVPLFDPAIRARALVFGDASPIAHNHAIRQLVTGAKWPCRT